MLDETTSHYREMINNAAQLMSLYFHKTICFSKVIQLSEADRRNVVLRLLIANPSTEMPRSLILKKTAVDKGIFDVVSNGETEIEQLSRFAHDWAGLEFLTQIGSNHAPHFYAGSLEYKFIIIEDLGLSHPSLVGPLTRSPSTINLQEAEIALIAYVRRLGKMHADTLGRENEFISILNRVYPQALRFNFIPEADGSEAFNQLKLLTGDKSQELYHEIQTILEFAKSPGDFNVFVHGDICPDNVYYQEKQIRLIDFEYSDYGHALIDGVYLRMSMPSCWCSKAVPDDVLQRMEAIYRAELKTALVLAGDDSVYNEGLVYACAYWILRSIKSLYEMMLIDYEWICPSGPVDADSEWEPKENAFRPRILSRLDAFIDCAKKTEHLPKFVEACQRLLAHLKNSWPETKYIDVFPVFRK